MVNVTKIRKHQNKTKDNLIIYQELQNAKIMQCTSQQQLAKKMVPINRQFLNGKVIASG